jgi:hypothetical protein
MIVREKWSGEEYSIPLLLDFFDRQWCIDIPELVETDEMPTRDLARRYTGNWNLVPAGDERYEFTPETDDEKKTLAEYGFLHAHSIGE